MTDSLTSCSILSEPGDRPDRAGNKKESIRIAKIPPRKKVRQKSSDGEPGKVVIRERRMTGMTRNQNLVGRAAGQKAFAIRQVPILESGIDAHLVFAIFQGEHLIMRETKPPIFLVVGRPVRNPFGICRKRIKV